MIHRGLGLLIQYTFQYIGIRKTYKLPTQQISQIISQKFKATGLLL